MQEKSKGKLLIEILVTLFAIIYVAPFILVLVNSFKDYRDILTNILGLPSKIAFENYSQAWKLMNYPKLFLNNLIVTVTGTAGIVFFGATAGYKLSRTEDKLISKIFFLVCIAPMLIPFQSFMIALVKMAKSLHLINSDIGLGVIFWGLSAPMATFLVHGFVKSIPRELDECAIIDGCSPFRAFFSVIFPLLKPVVSTIIILNVMTIWNDFLLALLMLNGNSESMTLQLSTYNFFGQYESQWNYAMAAVMLTILPVMIFFLAMQKNIIAGLTAGAVKG